MPFLEKAREIQSSFLGGQQTERSVGKARETPDSEGLDELPRFLQDASLDPDFSN